MTLFHRVLAIVLTCTELSIFPCNAECVDPQGECISACPAQNACIFDQDCPNGLICDPTCNLPSYCSCFEQIWNCTNDDVGKCVAPPAHPDVIRYRIRVLGPIDGVALGINNHGQVVGEMSTQYGRHAFLWENGRLTDIGLSAPSPYWMTAGAAINNHGQVAVFSLEESFLWDRGQVYPLGDLGFPVTDPFAINDSTQIVGAAYVSKFQYRAFQWESGTISELQVSNTDSRAYDINNRGEIVGGISTPNLPTGFIWKDGITQGITAGGGHFFSPSAINDHGVIAGTAGVDNCNSSAAIWQDGVSTIIGEEDGLIYTRGIDINNSGQVIGQQDRVYISPECPIAGECPNYPFLYDPELGLFSLYELIPQGTPGNRWRLLEPISKLILL